MKKIAVLCAGAAVCAALLAGCGSQTTQPTTSSEATAAVSSAAASATASATTSAAQTTSSTMLTAEEAQAIAMDAAKAVSSQSGETYTVTKCKLDYDDGVQVYDIDLVSATLQFSCEIDANTGAVREQKQEVITNSNTAISAAISADEALSIARNAAGITGTLVKNHLDYDDGRAVYEIELIDNNFEYDFEIDANTGTIIDQNKELQ